MFLYRTVAGPGWGKHPGPVTVRPLPHRDLPLPTAREKLHVSDPDLSTVTLADAHLLGGPEFVAQVREDATAVADELAPIEPEGEPVHRESACRVPELGYGF
jgi:hypothetical protein